MKIIDFIVCDDIRHEIGNKISVLGIYNDKIKVQTSVDNELKWPLAMRLGIFIRFERDVNDSKIDQLELSYMMNNAIVAKSTGPLAPITDSQIGTFTSVAQLFPLSGEGEITFKVDFISDKKIIQSVLGLGRLNVILERQATLTQPQSASV